MKPSWGEAPEWANWLAMDEDGSWGWFEAEPEVSDYFDMWDSEYTYLPAGKYYGDDDWTESLERRP